jgi:2-dehydropantoate 2-reductase
MLARGGVDVTLIGRTQHVDAINERGLEIDGVRVQARVAVKATTALEALGDATVVLFCVKTIDDEDAARALAPLLQPNAVVVSLQNGVDNVDRIRAATGIAAVPAVVYIAAEMSGPGRVRHTGRGDLIVGHPRNAPAQHADLEAIVSLFARGEVPCVISENIDGELWAKLIMNCAYNAISAVTQTRYGAIARNPLTRDVVRRAVQETVAVAHADGIHLPDTDFVAAAYRLGEVIAEALASTAQDLARGKRTEIDSLNGYVANRGAALGVDTPVNATLWALVRLAETPNSG